MREMGAPGSRLTDTSATLLRVWDVTDRYDRMTKMRAAAASARKAGKGTPNAKPKVGTTSDDEGGAPAAAQGA